MTSQCFFSCSNSVVCFIVGNVRTTAHSELWPFALEAALFCYVCENKKWSQIMDCGMGINVGSGKLQLVKSRVKATVQTTLSPLFVRFTRQSWWKTSLWYLAQVLRHSPRTKTWLWFRLRWFLKSRNPTNSFLTQTPLIRSWRDGGRPWLACAASSASSTWWWGICWTGRCGKPPSSFSPSSLFRTTTESASSTQTNMNFVRKLLRCRFALSWRSFMFAEGARLAYDGVYVFKLNAVDD